MIDVNTKQQQSEEDKLLDPIANSILRDLEEESSSLGTATPEAAAQAEGTVTAEAIQAETAASDNNSNEAEEAHNDEQHANSDHAYPTVQVSNGEILKCDPTELSENELIHCNAALEQNRDDENGAQGGQGWRSPTPRPTARPTSTPITAPPSVSPSSDLPDAPTWSPTTRGDPFVLQGIAYYDRNANGNRDSNIDTLEMGPDVEYEFGVGGVQIQLMECDPKTNMELDGISKYAVGDNSYAATFSQGYDVLFHPMLVGRAESGGK